MAVTQDPHLLRQLPHRPPILRVLRRVGGAGDRAVVVGREPAGPGALPWSCGCIEGIAQSAAVLLAGDAAPPADAPPPRGMLVAIKRLRIEAEPSPGEDILYEVRLVRRFGPTALVHGAARQGDRTLAEGDLTLWIAGG
jgi:hypothetical protein